MKNLVKIPSLDERIDKAHSFDAVHEKGFMLIFEALFICRAVQFSVQLYKT